MSSNLDQLPPANRILSLLFMSIVSSTLALSPIISSPLIYNQKESNLPLAEIDNQGEHVSEIDNQGAPLSAFLPLIPNVAFGQTDNGQDQPSSSFSLTVTAASCAVPGGGPPTNGDDVIFGGSGTDTINGGNGNDELHGCDGNDTLLGGNGQDKLFGENGDDFLNGGNAKDELTGGPGADTFDCGNADDIVHDFNAAEGDKFVNKNPPPATITTVAGSTCENAIFIDTTPPDTTITSAKDGQNNNVPNGGNNPTNSVTFEFTGTDNVGVDHFVCQLTGPTPSAASTCTSPKSYTGLADGSYTFSVFAVDPAGNADLSPATWEFTVAVDQIP